ncbi:MAG: fasciclin domain-containing protein [Flavobacteriales bacterium]|nr:fasciclin domain-containing protein [Flavobacteriales bacterium]
MKTTIKLATLMLAAGMGLNATAQMEGSKMKEKSVEVGGAPMYPSKNIIENAVNSKDHTTLVAAVKAAGLVETLSGPGPFTVFAPTNAAFDKLPKGTVDNLLKPENKVQLTGVLTYHVLAGKFSAKDVMAAIKKGGGKATMKTVAGGDLSFSMKGDKLMVWDTNGAMAQVTIADVNQSNGVIHVVDSVLLPKM